MVAQYQSKVSVLTKEVEKLRAGKGSSVGGGDKGYEVERLMKENGELRESIGRLN